MVLHTALQRQRLDVEILLSVAVLAEQEPGKAVIDAGLANGVLAVDGGVPAVKVDLQALVTLEIFKRQGNKLHFHDCIFLSDLLYCRCTELFFPFARRVCYHPAGLCMTLITLFRRNSK